jgi:hypothetical protein
MILSVSALCRIGLDLALRVQGTVPAHGKLQSKSEPLRLERNRSEFPER